MATLEQILKLEYYSHNATEFYGKNFPKIEAYLTLNFNAICTDSRQVRPHSLFLAVKGQVVDGRQFIKSAILQGASAVLFETNDANKHFECHLEKGIPCIAYYQLYKAIGKLAANFYQNPAQKLTLIGVTGTNGKTTISQLLAQWANLLNERAAVIGTIGNGLLPHLQTSTNTTPSPLQIQKNLADFVDAKATFCCMEVSSHGLDQYRVEGLIFQAIIFSNLTRDHLDYHQSMTNYAKAKKRLFCEFNCPRQIINADDETGKQWLTEFADAIAVSCCADFTPTHLQWLHATSTQFNANGVEIAFRSSWGEGYLQSSLIGAFNVNNLLLALATLLSLGYPLDQLCTTASQLKGVCGRMEMFAEVGLPTVIVDYAHTPDALQKALEAARLHCRGNLWCIFGCGGDRDAGKRPIMGTIAARLADHVILTDDNPRTENPARILLDIQKGIPRSYPHWQKIHQRQAAIEYALTNAKPNDVVLVAGKGHEDYQIIGNEYFHFSDQEVIKNYQKRRQND